MNRDCLHPSSNNLVNDSLVLNHYFNQPNSHSPIKQYQDATSYVSNHDPMDNQNGGECFTLVSPEEPCQPSGSLIPSTNLNNATAVAAAATEAEFPPSYYQYYLQRQQPNFVTPCNTRTNNFSCTDNMNSDHPMSISNQSIFSAMQSSSSELNQIIDQEDLSSVDQAGAKSGMVCLICEDKATGKHYGAYSCDGCKGFFRRSVRRNHSYTCRYKRNCIVTKDKRNQCRFCRLRKCFRVGMKKSAVQNERDKISNRSSSFDGSFTGSCLIDLHRLMYAEAVAHDIIQKNYTVTSKKHMGPNDCTAYDSHKLYGYLGGETELADAADICESIKTQLIFLIEWAKNLPSFTSLTTNDQIVLLQSHAGEMLILGAVWRSLNSGSIYRQIKSANYHQTTPDQAPTNSMISPNFKHTWSTNRDAHLTEISENEGARVSDYIESGVDKDTNEPQLILLGNSRIISRKSPQPEIAEIANLIFDQLYQPMQDLCLEEAEVACLRAIIFFDPNCRSLSEAGRAMVRACQYHIQLELMNIMNDKQYLPQGRFGALLLLLPDLRSVTYCMVQKLELARQMGLTRLDGLLTEILLSSTIINNNRRKTNPEDDHETLQHLNSLKFIYNHDSTENDTSTNGNAISNESQLFEQKSEANLTKFDFASTRHSVPNQTTDELEKNELGIQSLSYDPEETNNLPVEMLQTSAIETPTTTSTTLHSYLDNSQTNILSSAIHFSHSLDSLCDSSSSSTLVQGYRDHHECGQTNHQSNFDLSDSLNPIRRSYMSGMFDYYNSSANVNSDQRLPGTDLMNSSVFALQPTNFENFENTPNTYIQTHLGSTITSLDSQSEPTALMSGSYSVEGTFRPNCLRSNLNSTEQSLTQTVENLVDQQSTCSLTKSDLPNAFVYNPSSVQTGVDIVPQIVGNVISNIFASDQIQQ